MEKAKTILIVEDESIINDYISSILNDNGYRTLSALTGSEALSSIINDDPDLILLDLGLPDMDGATIIEETRSWTNVPIIILSCRDDVYSKVSILDLGADDYIAKPFDDNELLARIRTTFRHTSKKSRTDIYVHENLKIDYKKRMVFVNDIPIHLTNNEYQIVVFLSKNGGNLVTYQQLMEHVWGSFYIDDNNRILRVNLTNIRKKIEAETSAPVHIITEPGIGYRMHESQALKNY